jgi:hypothetical protein
MSLKSGMLGTGEPRLRPLDGASLEWAESVMRVVCANRLRADVERLPAPRNRLHAPDAMGRADEMIAQTFRGAGWAVERQAFELTNVMGCLDYGAGLLPAGVIPEHYARLEGANVVAVKEGSATKEAVVVAAHHDTIRDSPGADDNTASVAALMELARVLAPHSFEKSVVLAAFDMEEVGFFGSKEFVREFSRERRISCAVVYETMAYTSNEPGSQRMPPRVGRLYPEQMRRIAAREFVGDWTLVLYRRSSSSIATRFAEGLAHAAGAHAPLMMRDPADVPLLGRAVRRLMPGAHAFARSDHISFWDAGVPAVMITDTADFRSPHYHLPTDTPDTLDYERLAAIVGATAVAVAREAGLVKRGESRRTSVVV